MGGDHLRMRVYDHLQHLSLGYYDSHQTGALLSTITDDIKTIQGFASSFLTLDIFTDLLTIVGMFGVMLWLEFDFALIAVALTPLLLLFVARLNRSVKRHPRGPPPPERYRRGGAAGPRIHPGRRSVRAARARRVPPIRREPSDGGRRAQSPAGEIAALAGGHDRGRPLHGVVLWRGTALVLADVMTVGALTVFLAYLSKFFGPVQDLAKMSNTLAQTAVAMERVQTILDTQAMVPWSVPTRASPEH